MEGLGACLTSLNILEEFHDHDRVNENDQHFCPGGWIGGAAHLVEQVLVIEPSETKSHKGQHGCNCVVQNGHGTYADVCLLPGGSSHDDSAEAEISKMIEYQLDD